METAVRESEELFYRWQSSRRSASSERMPLDDDVRQRALGTITGLSLGQALHDRWQVGLHPRSRARAGKWQQAVRSGEPSAPSIASASRWAVRGCWDRRSPRSAARATFADTSDHHGHHRPQAGRAGFGGVRTRQGEARGTRPTPSAGGWRASCTTEPFRISARSAVARDRAQAPAQDRIGAAIERLTAVITELRTVVDNLQPGDLSRASLQEAIAATPSGSAGRTTSP